MLMLKKLIIFNVQYNRVVLKFEDFTFQANRIAGFFFLIILSELTDQCIIAIYRQGSSALLVHLVDRTLRDLMQLDDAQATDKIFGGKTMVLGGDFRQILPAIPKGGREDIVSASLPRSHLWQHVTILRLHINMRVMATNSEEQ
jgi:hypothetical protein